MRIVKVPNTLNQPIYQVHGQEAYFRRVIGGLAWPALSKPGWLVVVGEDLGLDKGLGARRMRILAEASGEGLAELHLKALELRFNYQVEIIMAHTKDKAEVLQWRQFNSRLSMNQEISLMPAPYSGEAAQVLYQIIDNQIMPGRKVLSFGAESKMSQEFMNLRLEDLKGCVDQFPALAALGYAIAELVLQAPAGRQKMPEVVREWNTYEDAERR